MKRTSKSNAAFTLIELLVVIAIIASIIALAVPNYLGARQRAADSKRKSEMEQLKTALRLYNNDFHTYPTGTNGTVLNGCKAGGTTACPCSSGSIDFASGAACDNVYMKKFPSDFGTTIMKYYQASSGDDFCLGVTLDNKSDPEIATSQNRCRSVCSTYYSSGTYWICSD